MLTPAVGSFLHTSTPWAAVTLHLASPWHGTNPGLCWEGNAASTAPGSGSRTPLTCCILSSPSVIFPHLKSCLLQLQLPTTTSLPFPLRFQGKEGGFIVRDSTSKTGKYTVSVYAKSSV